MASMYEKLFGPRQSAQPHMSLIDEVEEQQMKLGAPDQQSPYTWENLRALAPADPGSNDLDDLDLSWEAAQKMAMEQGGSIPDSLMPVYEWSKGMNSRIAGIVGETAQFTHNVLKSMGEEFFTGKVEEMTGIDFQKPGAVTNRLKEEMAKLHIRSDPVDSLAFEVGEDTVDAAIITAAFFAAAPRLAAAQGQSVRTFIKNDLGRFMLDHPYLAAAIDFGSQVGATSGQRAMTEIGAPGWLGAVPGAMLSGLGVAGGARMTRAVWDKTAGKFFAAPQPTKPIYDMHEMDAEVLRREAAKAVDADIAAIDRQIALEIDARRPHVAGKAMPPDDYEVNFRHKLEQIEARASGVVNSYWEAVPKTKPVNPDPLIRLHAAQVAEAERGTYTAYPAAEWAPLMNLAEGGGIPTIEKLLATRKDVLRARLFEEAKRRKGEPVNEGLIRSYIQMEETILDSIKAQYPKDKTIEMALQVSRAFHKRFTDGPVGRVLSGTWRADTVADTNSVDYLMRNSGIMDIDETGRSTAVPGTVQVLNQFPYGSQVSKNMMARDYREIAEEMDLALRAQFAEMAKQDPKRAQEWYDKFRKSIEPLAKLQSDIELTLDNVTMFLDQQARMNASALAKAGQGDPQQAIKTVWDFDPVPGKRGGVSTAQQQNRNVMARFAGNEDALNAWKNFQVSELFRRSRGSAVRMQAILDDPNWGPMLRDTLSSGEWTRLERIVTIGRRLEMGDERLLRGMARKGSANLLAAFFGAATGRHISALMGARGTIQIPGKAASFTQNAVMAALERWGYGAGIDNLIARAVMDPKWERLLMRQVPRDTKEALAMRNQWRRMMGVEAGIETGVEGLKQRAEDLQERRDIYNMDKQEQPWAPMSPIPGGFF